jgi:hypothetical protein
MLVVLTDGRSSGQAETDIVVPVVSVIPVAASDPGIVIIIVPGTATQHGGAGNTRGEGRSKKNFFGFAE